MAEFLVFAEDRDDKSKTAEDSMALLKRGDVTEVRPDGFVWGREESKAVWVAEGRDPDKWLGKTILIKVPGMPVPRRDKIVRPETRPLTIADPEFNADELMEPQTKVTHQYAWRVNLRKLPPAARAKLIADREITATRAQFRRHVDHKVTRARFDERRANGEGVKRKGVELDEKP